MKEKSDRQLVEELTSENRELRERIKQLEMLSFSQTAEISWHQGLEAIPDLVLILDDQHRIIFANRALQTRLGVDLSQVIGRHCYSLMHGSSAPPDFCPHARLLADGMEHTVEIYEPHLEGRFLVSVCPLKDRQGQLTGSIHIARDITALQQAGDKLKDSEERFRAVLSERREIGEALSLTRARLEFILSQLPSVIYSCRIGGDYPATFLSDNVRKQFGYDPKDFTEAPHFWISHIHPDDAPRVLDELSSLLDTGFHTSEYRLLHGDGSYRWVYDEARLIHASSGEPVEIVGYLRDISQRKHIEEAMLRSEQRYRSLFEESPISLWELDCSLAKLYVDELRARGVADLRAYAAGHPEELSRFAQLVRIIAVNRVTLDIYEAKDIEELVNGICQPECPQLNGTILEILSAVAAGLTCVQVDTVIRTLQGHRKYLSLRWSAASGCEETLSRVLLSVGDITPRKEAEKALEYSYRFLEIAYTEMDLPSLAQAFLRETKNFTGCSAVGIRLFDGEHRIRYSVHEGFDAQFYEKQVLRLTRPEQCLCVNVIQGTVDPGLPYFTEGGSFFINAATSFLTDLPELMQLKCRILCNKLGYESVAHVPIRHQNRILGLIHVADGAENMLPEQTVRSLEKAAMQFGAAIQRIESACLLQEIHRELEARVWARTEDLRKQASFSDGIIECAAEGLCVCHEIQHFPYVAFTVWNARMTEITGYTMEEINRQGWYQSLYPDSEVQARAAERMQRMRRGEDLAGEEWEITRADGEKRIVLISTRIVASNGDAPHVLAMMHDVTDRKRAELHIRTERDKLQSILSALGVGVSIISRECIIEYQNESHRRWFGERIGEQCVRVFHGSCNELCKEALLRGGSEACGLEISELHFGGRDYERNIFPFLDVDGARKTLVLLRDVTEKRRLEKEISRADRLASLGQLAGGIAHDFNNILGTIITCSELAQEDLPPENGSAREDLDHVLKAAKRGKTLIKQILTFSRQDEHEHRPMHPAPVVQECLKLIRSSVPSTIEIHQNVRAKSSTILGDPTQIHQVLMNLCTNAVHAMRGKGDLIEVSLLDVELDSDSASRIPNGRPGSYVELTVKDNGHGMEPSLIEHIFVPFFTTKPRGEGTGLGLSMVHGIVKGMKGSITVSSEPGKGTAFVILFPKLEPSGKEPGEEASVLQTDGKGIILFVDDEENIVYGTTKLLKRMGYETVGFTSSAKALEAFRAAPSSFDLIITDLIMPQKDGVELARELVSVRPDIPIILCSGMANATRTVLYFSPAELAAAGVREVVPKPLDRSQLSGVIQRVLHNTGGRIEDGNRE